SAHSGGGGLSERLPFPWPEEPGRSLPLHLNDVCHSTFPPPPGLQQDDFVDGG
ncbi:unnamed protein product, partial [Effrenium voratum]